MVCTVSFEMFRRMFRKVRPSAFSDRGLLELYTHLDSEGSNYRMPSIIDLCLTYVEYVSIEDAVEDGVDSSHVISTWDAGVLLLNL